MLPDAKKHIHLMHFVQRKSGYSQYDILDLNCRASRVYIISDLFMTPTNGLSHIAKNDSP